MPVKIAAIFAAPLLVGRAVDAAHDSGADWLVPVSACIAAIVVVGSCAVAIGRAR